MGKRTRYSIETLSPGVIKGRKPLSEVICFVEVCKVPNGREAGWSEEIFRVELNFTISIFIHRNTEIKTYNILTRYKQTHLMNAIHTRTKKRVTYMHTIWTLVINAQDNLCPDNS